MKYLGISEKENPEQVLTWLKTAGVKNATMGMGWCAAFVYSMFLEAGLKSYSCNSASVATWKATWGKEVKTPQVGDLAFWEEYSHIGIVIKIEGDKVVIISGNYSDKVSIEKRFSASHYKLKRGL
ncbi:MAG: CHAP domain-containing protein [Bacteroidaceae bacterium]|nr:CHAP domain-containing protein [Bacteroidaceae bacterium]